MQLTFAKLTIFASLSLGLCSLGACQSPRDKYPELVMRPYNKSILRGHQVELGEINGDPLKFYLQGYAKLYPETFYRRRPAYQSHSPEFFLARLIAKFKDSDIAETGDIKDLRRRADNGEVSAIFYLAERLNPNITTQDKYSGVRKNREAAARHYFQIATGRTSQSEYALRRLTELELEFQQKPLQTVDVIFAKQAISEFQQTYQAAIKSNDLRQAVKQLKPYYKMALPLLIQSHKINVQQSPSKLLQELARECNLLTKSQPKTRQEWQNWLNSFSLHENLNDHNSWKQRVSHEQEITFGITPLP